MRMRSLMSSLLLWVGPLLLAPATPGAAQAGTGLASRPESASVGRRLAERQTSDSQPLRRLVTLDLQNVTLKSALEAIDRQAALGLIYTARVVPLGRRVTVQVDHMPADAALREVLRGTNAVVEVAAGQIVLVQREQVAPPPQGGVVAGRVSDVKTGTSIAGATVLVEGTSRSATTGNDGRYRIADVMPGTYPVRARYIGYAPGTASVTVSADQEVTADFALDKSAQRLDEVVTTGTLIPTEVKALPTPITVITADDIERQHPRRFDQLLQLAVPGAVVWEPDGTFSPVNQQVSFRGTSGLVTSSNPKVYIDGIETADRIGLSIDPQSIERIEVVRGPQAAAIYGSDAMGGVIQIFTKRGAAARQRPELQGQAALGRIESAFPESGALRQEYTAGLTGKTGMASYRLGGGYRRTGEWMPEYGEATPNLQGAARFEQGPLTLNLSARFDQVTFEQGFNSLLVATGTPGVETVPAYRRTQGRSETYGVQVAYRPLQWWQHDVTVGVDRYSSSRVQFRPRLRTPTDTLLLAEDRQQQKLSIGYHTAVIAPIAAGLSTTLIAGVDHYTYTDGGFSTTGAVTTLPLVLAPGQSISAFRQRTTNTGLFAQMQLNVHEALFVTGSVRAEDNSDFGAALNWPRSTKVGLAYVRDFGGPTVKLRVSYGQAIRPPFFGAKDSLDFGCGCFYQLANPGLRPERQVGPDGGVDLVFGRRGSLSVTYYNQTAKDFLYATPNFSVFPATLQYQNLARVKNSGWEFEGTLELGRIAARGNFAITHSRPEDLTPITEYFALRVGQQMQGMPEHTGAVTLTAAALRRTSVTAGLAYQGGWLGVDDLALSRCQGGTGPCNDPTGVYFGRYPGVVKLNLGVDQQVAHSVTAYLSVEDITNRAIRRSLSNLSPIPGRISTVGVRVRY